MNYFLKKPSKETMCVLKKKNMKLRKHKTNSCNRRRNKCHIWLKLLKQSIYSQINFTLTYKLLLADTKAITEKPILLKILAEV